MEKKKKIFPKFKKKLEWFLTDESGKISKKDALWIAAWGVILAAANTVSAGHSSSYSGLPGGNSHSNWHGWNCSRSVSYSEHASWIVNGHLSSNVSGTKTATCYGGTGTHGNVRHSSHGSHGSHWSHGSRW